MRRTARVWFATTALLVGLVAPAHAVTAAGYGALPYLRASDSPFAGGPPFGGTFSYFHLEDFEDGALNTPGVSANAGSVISGNGFVDSVDADDGTVDGSGLGGKSWYSTGGATLFVFTFNEVALGGLPNYAGVVWTDVGVNAGPTTGVGPVEFRAYDKDGVLQITIGAAALGDGNVTGQTAEDRFFGAFIASAFISRIEIEMPTSGDWEVDHLQYGRATTPSVPTPASAAMMVAAILGLAAVRRRRR